MFYRSFAMLVALVSFNCFSSVQLRVPDSVDLLSVNMSEPTTEGGFFQFQNYTARKWYQPNCIPV